MIPKNLPKGLYLVDENYINQLREISQEKTILWNDQQHNKDARPYYGPIRIPGFDDVAFFVPLSSSPNLMNRPADSWLSIDVRETQREIILKNFLAEDLKEYVDSDFNVLPDYQDEQGYLNTKCAEAIARIYNVDVDDLRLAIALKLNDLSAFTTLDDGLMDALLVTNLDDKDMSPIVTRANLIERLEKDYKNYYSEKQSQIWDTYSHMTHSEEVRQCENYAVLKLSEIYCAGKKVLSDIIKEERKCTNGDSKKPWVDIPLFDKLYDIEQTKTSFDFNHIVPIPLKSDVIRPIPISSNGIEQDYDDFLNRKIELNPYSDIKRFTENIKYINDTEHAAKIEKSLAGYLSRIYSRGMINDSKATNATGDKNVVNIGNVITAVRQITSFEDTAKKIDDGEIQLDDAAVAVRVFEYTRDHVCENARFSNLDQQPQKLDDVLREAFQYGWGNKYHVSLTSPLTGVWNNPNPASLISNSGTLLLYENPDFAFYYSKNKIVHNVDELHEIFDNHINHLQTMKDAIRVKKAPESFAEAYERVNAVKKSVAIQQATQFDQKR